MDYTFNNSVEKVFADYMNKQITDTLLTSKPVITKSITADDLKNVVKVFKETKNDPHLEEPKEEWIWVTGYKGTEKDMKCRDYQYEMGKLHTMPEDADIVDCKSGFHLCLNMGDVRRYYEVRDGRRYFEVQALVRKRDFDNYGKTETDSDNYRTQMKYYAYFSNGSNKRDKLAAKSIIFTRELGVDEILKGTTAENWPAEFKQMAISDNISDALHAMQAKELTGLGFSEAFSKYIAREQGYEVAKEVASQKDLSMDMKVLCILRGI